MSEQQETRGDRATYPAEHDRLVLRAELDAARLREQAALGQARLARESLAAMGDKLIAVENHAGALTAQLEAAEARAARLAVALERTAYVKHIDVEHGDYIECRLCREMDGHKDGCVLSATPTESLARLRALEELASWIASQLPPEDTYGFLSQLEMKVADVEAARAGKAKR